MGRARRTGFGVMMEHTDEVGLKCSSGYSLRQQKPHVLELWKVKARNSIWES